MRRSLERGKKTVDEIRASKGKADFIASDLLNAASAREVAKKAIEVIALCALALNRGMV